MAGLVKLRYYPAALPMFIQRLRETKLTKSESLLNIKDRKSRSIILDPAKAL